ncbi:MAG: hypothetical protein AAB437_04775 [Patescibacteria group bacterium]
MTNEILEQLMIKNLNTRIDLSDIRLLKSAFGPIGVSYFISNLRGKSPMSETLSRDIDRIFFENLSKEMGSPFSHGQFLNALKKANETHNYVVSSLGLPQMDAGLINNTKAFSESPFRRLDLLSQRDVDPLLRFQLAEQLILGLIHAHLDNRTKEKRLSTQLQRFVDFIDNEIFSEKIRGKREKINIYSTHDFENEVKRIGKTPFLDVYKNEHQKQTPFRVRRIIINGKNFTVPCDDRKKDDSIAALKSLEKAIHQNQGDVRIEEDVEDMIGTTFIVIEGNMKDFISYFEEKARKEYGDIRIEVDDEKKDNTRKTSQRHTFNRRQLYFEGYKIEAIFYSLREYLTSEYDIGEKDKNGFYNGAAHSLYGIGRNIHAAKHIIPEDLYGLDIDEYGSQAQEYEAQRLLHYNNFSP